MGVLAEMFVGIERMNRPGSEQDTEQKSAQASPSPRAAAVYDKPWVRVHCCHFLAETGAPIPIRLEFYTQKIRHLLPINGDLTVHAQKTEQFSDTPRHPERYHLRTSAREIDRTR